MTLAAGRAGVEERIVSTQTWIIAGVASALALIGNVVALADWRAVYGNETSPLVNAALAQDVMTAVVVVPLVVVTAVLVSRGSVRAHLIGLGALAFLVYNYVIYCFSISFGPLFLVWTAVLGLSVFALANGIRVAARVDVRSAVRPSKFAVVVLVAVAVLFAVLWLSEILPDTINGRASTSAAEWDIPTNPVHVLDLGLFLPTAFMVGLGLRKHHSAALMLAPGMLVWFGLTALPIVLTPVVATVRSDDAAWGAVGPVTGIIVAALIALRYVIAPARESQ